MRWYVPDGALAGNAFFAESREAGETTTISNNVNVIVTGGYYTPGDGGSAEYRRVASEPTHAGKFRSFDGAWWEICSEVLDVKMLGGISDLEVNSREFLQATVNTSEANKSPSSFVGEFLSKAGAAWNNPTVSDPDSSAVYITAPTSIDGAGKGYIYVDPVGLEDSSPKSALYIGNDTEVVSNVSIRNLKLFQPDSIHTSDSGLTDDYFTLRFNGTHGCVADNIYIESCNLGITFTFNQLHIVPDRSAIRNKSDGGYSPRVRFMYFQSFGEKGATHSNHRAYGLALDNVGRASHMLRLTGFDFAPCIGNTYSNFTAEHFANGLSMQTHVRSCQGNITAIDCQNAVVVNRQATAAEVACENNFTVTATNCEYGIFDLGGRDNIWSITTSNNTNYGIEATNAGTKTFNAATAVDVASNTIIINAHAFATLNTVILSTGAGSAPGGLANGAQYWIIVVDANSIRLASSLANAQSNTPIDITSVGSGTVAIIPTEWSSGNSYSGKIINPIVRGCNLSRTVYTNIDLHIDGILGTTAIGLNANSIYGSGEATITNCNTGAIISGDFNSYKLNISNCNTALSVTGHENNLELNVVGNIVITGNNNKITGRVTGTITNSGTGNVITAKSDSGTSTADTDSNGLVTVSHSLGYGPRKVVLTSRDNASRSLQWTTANANTFTVRVFSGTSPLASTATTFTWEIS